MIQLDPHNTDLSYLVTAGSVDEVVALHIHALKTKRDKKTRLLQLDLLR